MEDVVTDIPPPSRFFLEDLNNFTQPPTTLPSPFLLFSNPSNPSKPLRPSLLIIALSPPSLYFFHRVSSNTLVGTLILPEIPLSGNSIEPSLKDKSCDMHNLEYPDETIIVLSFKYSVPAERSHAVAKLLIGDQIIPDRVLILDSVQGRNFRGRVSAEDSFAMKLETLLERRGPQLLKGLKYFPSGSVMDGLAAALLSRCQLMDVRGTLCVSCRHDYGGSVTFIRSLLLKDVLPKLECSFGFNGEGDGLKVGRHNGHPRDSDMYS